MSEVKLLTAGSKRLIAVIVYNGKTKQETRKGFPNGVGKVRQPENKREPSALESYSTGLSPQIVSVGRSAPQIFQGELKWKHHRN